MDGEPKGETSKRLEQVFQANGQERIIKLIGNQENANSSHHEILLHTHWMDG